jgi:hypothetical protein
VVSSKWVVFCEIEEGTRGADKRESRRRGAHALQKPQTVGHPGGFYWLKGDPPAVLTGCIIRKRALTGRINPINMSENVITLMREVRARCSPRHADATQSLKSLKERATLCVRNGKIIMGNAQTQTMMAMMSQATRFPATSHVQVTMRATMITVREARPAVRVMVSPV